MFVVAMALSGSTLGLKVGLINLQYIFQEMRKVTDEMFSRPEGLTVEAFQKIKQVSILMILSLFCGKFQFILCINLIA